MSQTPSRRRWTVRGGTDGHGKGFFEVYAPTMEAARESVAKSAEESGDIFLRALVNYGYTVHATDQRTVWECQTLRANVWIRETPAPDFPRELATA